MSTASRPVVLVTGSARRLGRALALDFVARGWTVAAHVHTHDDQAESLAEEARQAGGTLVLCEADLSADGAGERLMRDVAASIGNPSCLVNNASAFEYDDIASLEPARWSRHLAVNLTAPVFLAKALGERLPAGHKGNVINILDQRVWKPTPHFLSYAGSKAALWAMTQMLAQALAPCVRVNAIGPGPMLQSKHQSAADFRAQYEATPLARPTTPDEVAAAIRFILDAPAMTGQMIALDGGQHLAWQTPDIGDGRG